jgi:hypothetical protein
MINCLFIMFVCRICSQPAESCFDRVPLNAPVNKCGVECPYDPVTNTCVNSCPRFYVKNATSGACQIATCAQLIPNRYFKKKNNILLIFFFDIVNSSFPSNYCGDKCVALNGSACGESCPPFYQPDPVTKVFLFI